MTDDFVTVDVRDVEVGDRLAGLCSVDQCGGRTKALGLCGTHRRRLAVHGDVLASVPIRRWVDRYCSVDGCVRPYKGLGLCKTHLRALKLYGDAKVIDNRERRVWPRYPTTPRDTPCREYPLRGTGGYGRRTVDGHRVLVHRWIWSTVHGAIPDGMCVMHLCDNPACYRLDHLRVGTIAENNADMAAKGRAANQTTRWRQGVST